MYQKRQFCAVLRGWQVKKGLCCGKEPAWSRGKKMKLDIDDNSLYALLQEKREQIGQSWISGAFNIAAAVSLAITGYTTDLHIGMQIFVCIAAVFLTVVGIWQCCISL